MIPRSVSRWPWGRVFTQPSLQPLAEYCTCARVRAWMSPYNGGGTTNFVCHLPSFVGSLSIEEEREESFLPVPPLSAIQAACLPATVCSSHSVTEHSSERGRGRETGMAVGYTSCSQRNDHSRRFIGLFLLILQLLFEGTKYRRRRQSFLSTRALLRPFRFFSLVLTSIQHALRIIPLLKYPLINLLEMS